MRYRYTNTTLTEHIRPTQVHRLEWIVRPSRIHYCRHPAVAVPPAAAQRHRLLAFAFCYRRRSWVRYEFRVLKICNGLDLTIVLRRRRRLIDYENWIDDDWSEDYYHTALERATVLTNLMASWSWLCVDSWIWFKKVEDECNELERPWDSRYAMDSNV